MSRRRILKGSIGEAPQLPDGSTALPMSVVFANKNNGRLTIVEGNKWNTAAYPPSIFEPIGIVVIPGEHGVLKDGTGTVNQCGVMSIVPMNYNTPETGGTSDALADQMYWGYVSTNYSGISGKSDGLGRYDSVSNGLLDYMCVVTTADTTSNVASGYSGTKYAYIPSQSSVGRAIIRWESDSPYAPSPYIGSDYKSGGYNESYGLKDGVVGIEAYNVLSDFKGIVNTKIITDLAASQSDWKTASSITNNSGSGYYPAACCCARYKTIGTKSFIESSTEELKEGKGFWYLPAAGELGYIMPRLYDINDTISKLNTAYGVGVRLNTSNDFWSSSEYSGYDARYVYTYIGSVGHYNKDYNGRVRAFLRL